MSFKFERMPIVNDIIVIVTLAVVHIIFAICLLLFSIFSKKDILHPYNQCLNVFVEETRINNEKVDFNKAKSFCFELLKKNK